MTAVSQWIATEEIKVVHACAASVVLHLAGEQYACCITKCTSNGSHMPSHMACQTNSNRPTTIQPLYGLLSRLPVAGAGFQLTCDPQNTLQKCGRPCPGLWHAPLYYKRAPAHQEDGWVHDKVIATCRTLTSMLWLHVRSTIGHRCWVVLWPPRVVVIGKDIRTASKAYSWTGADPHTLRSDS